MLIAAFDSTAVTCSASVAEIDEKGLHTYSLFTVKNKLTHSETLMPMFDSALKAMNADIGDIKLFAVNAGPGSFTGVRIGVSTVKGLALPNGIPCAGISTLESLSKHKKQGVVCALMDARRQQFYFALFKDGKRLTEDRAAGIETISDALSEYKECTLLGDGAKLFESLYHGKCKVNCAEEVAVDQNALSVAVCGYEYYTEGKTVSASDLKPVYLRMPQAEREKLEREKREKEKTEKGDTK